MEFAVINSSTKLSQVDAQFAVVACSKQVLDFCEDWSLAPVAAALYTAVEELPQDDIWVCEILDSLDDPGALGYHTEIGGRPVLRVLASGDQTAGILSHEFLETLGDPTCDRWADIGDGRRIALEVCDPVEADTYPIVAEVAGEGRTVEVSNYCLPPYFGTGAGLTNKMGLELEPFGLRPGGYAVILGTDGNESEVFARLVHGENDIRAKNAAATKLRRADSRLWRRLVRHPVSE